MDKYLIINADDFGMCRAANLAVMDLLKSGSITSSTIMAPCPWAYEACQFAKKNPQFAIGVHLTFTSEWATYRWSPVGTSNTDSLRDELGFMHPESIDVEKNADIKEVAAEIHAQINRLKALGLTPLTLTTIWARSTASRQAVSSCFSSCSASPANTVFRSASPAPSPTLR